jgi:hypothetical protein
MVVREGERVAQISSQGGEVRGIETRKTLEACGKRGEE